MNAFEDEHSSMPGPFSPRRGSWGGMAIAGSSWWASGS